MVQINDKFYVRGTARAYALMHSRSRSQEDLTPESMVQILDDLAAGKQPKTGPHSARKGSEPNGPLTALTDIVRSLFPTLPSYLADLLRNAAQRPEGALLG